MSLPRACSASDVWYGYETQLRICYAISRLHMPCCAREFAEETLGLFGDCSVTAAGVQLAADLMAYQLRAKAFTLHVKHQLKSGVYHMFVALLPHVEPLMFHLATQQNLQTGAIEGAEMWPLDALSLPASGTFKL